MNENENYWQYMLRMTQQGDVVYYVSDIPSPPPYGLTIELYHNKTHDVYVKILPASGSHMEIIQKEEADTIIARSKVVKEYGYYMPESK